MTNTKDEALKSALEALEDLQRQYSIYPNSFWDWSKGRKAITTLTQAIAAPNVQEPVAWRRFNGSRFEYIEHIPALSGMVSEDWIPLHDPSQLTAPEKGNTP